MSNERYQEANKKLAELRGDLADRQGRVEAAKLRKPELLENISRWTAEQHLDGANHTERISQAQAELVQIEATLTDWPHIEQELQRRVGEAERVFIAANQLVEIEKLEAIRAEMAVIAGELDNNVGQSELWVKLIQLSKLAYDIYLYTSLRTLDSFGSEFASDPGVVLNRWQFEFRRGIEETLRGGSVTPSMPSISSGLNLPNFATRIHALRTKIDIA